MRKIAVIVAVLSVLAIGETGVAQIVNGDWGTGDETGWTRFRAPWGSSESWTVTAAGPTPPEGTLSISTMSGGDFGWYQVVDVSGVCTLDCLWQGNIDGSSWCEVMFFSVPEGTSSGDIENRILVGADPDTAYMKDSFGVNPPTNWGWQPASLSPAPSGNGGAIFVPGGEDAVVALKLGTMAIGTFIFASFDDIGLQLPVSDWELY